MSDRVSVGDDTACEPATRDRFFPGPQGRLRLSRLPFNGAAGYRTFDGHFDVEQGANGAGAWVITPRSPQASRLLDACGETVAFRRLRDAREFLAGSIYGPHGWAWASDADIRQAIHDRVYASEGDH